MDVQTSFIFSASLMITISAAMFFYVISRKENRDFIWLSLAAGLMAVAYILFFLRGRIPDFFSIIVSNELTIFCMIAFYEIFRRFLSVSSKVRQLGYGILILQAMAFIWFTYFSPDFQARVVILNVSIGIMSFFIIRLLLSSISKAQRIFHIFAAVPFMIVLLINILRIGLYFSGQSFSENSFTSPAFAVSHLIYCILVLWICFATIFISANGFQNTLTQIALTDSLTGILNRRAFSEALKRAMAKARRTGSPLSLIVTDLDHFKMVNDKYGHPAGDAVLVHIVNLFRRLVRAEDLLARYGGEEFVIILPGVDAAYARGVAERLRKACRENSLTFESQLITVTSSFGISAFSGGAMDGDRLVRQADKALYKAKTSGRDTAVVFENPAPPPLPS